MKRLALTAACGMAFAASASSDPLCDAARSELERYAQANSLRVEVRCRPSSGVSPASHAEVQAATWPSHQVPRSGALTWPVRVLAGSARHQVRHVPLTVSWTAPAWVGTHDLQRGALLQQGDVELQTRRWPDGLTVQPAESEQPPTGRLRQALRAGEILSAAAVLSADSLQRGDRVTAVVAEGAMEIRMPAQLLAPARVGERTRVQASGRLAALEGRLIDSQTLRVDSQ